METSNIRVRNSDLKGRTPWQLLTSNSNPQSDSHSHHHPQAQLQPQPARQGSEDSDYSDYSSPPIGRTLSVSSSNRPYSLSPSGSSSNSTLSKASASLAPTTPPDSIIDSPNILFQGNGGNGIGGGGQSAGKKDLEGWGGVAAGIYTEKELQRGATSSESSQSRSGFEPGSMESALKLGGLGLRTNDFHQGILQSSPTPSPSSSTSINSPNSKSKNDIFASSSPRISPAPRIASSGFALPSPISASPSTSTKNGAFFGSGSGSWSTSSLNRVSSPTQDLPSSPSLNPKSSNLFNNPTPPPRLPLPSRRRSQSLTPTLELQSSTSPAQSPSNSAFKSRADSNLGHVKQRPSLGRQTTEEREKERARIRSSKEVEYRLRPTKEYCLGEGRHCNVFLGAWRKSGTPYRLCAVKRLHPNRESNLLGLDEAFALRRLGSHPHIVSLIDIKDEVTIGDSESSYMTAGSSSQKKLGRGYPSAAPLSAGPELMALATSRLSTGESSRMKGITALKVPIPSHARSVSNSNGGRDEPTEENLLEELAKRSSSKPVAPEEQDAAFKLSLVNHRRFVSQPIGETTMRTKRSETRSPLTTNAYSSQEGPEVRVADVDLRKVSASSTETTVSSSTSSSSGTALPNRTQIVSEAFSVPATPSPSVSPLPTPQPSTTPTPTADPPRLLILLELLPISLSDYARKNPVDMQLWMKFAIELSSTLAWIHEKGCVHADIKKENIMVSMGQRAKVGSQQLGCFYEPTLNRSYSFRTHLPQLTEDLTTKLVDFNSALFPNPLSPPTDGLGLGTPAYGAPELTRAFSSSSSSASTFSYSIDVWSLGAVLYSLASGVEPFSRARSMMDMMHRKRVFFQSEEDDRIARISVGNGWGGSNQGSASTSRTGSLRGRKVPRWENKDTNSSSSLKARYRREGSTDSLESVASSITNMNGNSPSNGAIRALLSEDESDDFSSELVQATDLLPGINVSNHHRTASLGKAHSRSTNLVAISSSTANPASTSTDTSLELIFNPSARLGTPARPTLLKRSTSYNDEAMEDVASQNASDAALQAQVAAATQAQVQQNSLTPSSNPSLQINAANLPPVSPGGSGSQLHRDVAAAFAQASRASSHSRNATKLHLPNPSSESGSTSSINQRRREKSSSSSSTSFRDEKEDEEEEEMLLEQEKQDAKTYRDGSPALILPGGGRLPDEARDLLARMLDVDPSRRPSAKEVFEKLIKIQISEQL